MNTTYFKNPFSLEPIRLLAKFFGRQKETRQALGFLHHGQCVSIAGQDKIGKTSFLFHVAHPYVRAERKLAQERVFVQLDGHSMTDFVSGQCYLHIREETIRQVKDTLSVNKEVGERLEQAVREASLGTAYFCLNTLFQAAKKNDLKLVLVLDNFDSLAQSSNLEDEFFAALRSLHHKYPMAYLVASRNDLHTLERIRPEGSPFFNIFQPINLKPLTSRESQQLIATLLKQAKVGFPEFIIEHILELGQNEPHALQRAGYIAFELWQENRGDLHTEHRSEIKRRFGERES